MKKVFLALSLTLLVGTVATASYATTDNTVKTEIEKKKDDKKKKAKKKASAKKKGGCCAASSCCTKKKN